jgi:transglutaminase-like putative cysteine protease
MLGSALVAAATTGSLLALSGLIAPGRWQTAATVAVVTLAVLTAAVRHVTRSWWAPSLTGLVALVLGLLVVYGGPPGRVQVVPDTGSLERLLAAAREAVVLINAALVPMDAARPVELLVVAGACTAFLVADALAIGLGATAWSGLVLGFLWIPAIVLGFPATAWALFWTGLAYLLLLGLSAAPPASAEQGRRRALETLAGAATIVAATLVAGPVVAAAPGWASFDLPQLGSGPVGPLRLSDDLDLRESLGTRSAQVVMRYTIVRADSTPEPAPQPTGTEQAPPTDARLVGPLRAFTLRDFDGRSWQRSEGGELLPWDPETLLTSDPALQGTPLDPAAGNLARVEVRVEGLREQRLPVSTFPRTVAIDGAWAYDAEQDEIVGSRSTRPGTAYSMTVQVAEITADGLRAAGAGAPPDVDAYTAVAQTEHTEDIRALAQEITAGADGTYDQALALQTYFRDGRNFTYDTRIAPARTDDAVWDFLDSRSGYCVQFATSMTMMARTLGIPARIGVGFLPGVPNKDLEYVVTGRQAHAWPELYFEGAGWVRFEPTPSVQSGLPPRWSDPLAFVTGAPDDQEIPQLPTAAPSGAPVPGATTDPGASVQDDGLPRGLAVGAVLLVLSAVAGGVVLVLRRRTASAVELDPERAWERLRERLGAAGVSWPTSTTPRQAVDVVRARVLEIRGEPWSDEADTAFRALARAVETERYSPRPVDVTATQLEAWVAVVLDAVLNGSRTPVAAGATPTV